MWRARHLSDPRPGAFSGPQLAAMSEVKFRRLIYPSVPDRPVPPEVPDDLASDYREAVAHAPSSPKASPALSRQCLQNTIR